MTIEKTTLGKNGLSLPYGILNSQQKLEKMFAFKPWTFAEELQIGEFRGKNKNASIGQYVGMILSTMLTSVGPHKDFQSLKIEERRIHVGQMTMADVLYSWICLRREAIGENLDLTISCRRCQHEFGFSANLDTVDVAVANEKDDGKWIYKLNKSFDIRGKKAESFELGPTIWGSFDGDATIGMNPAALISAVICGSILSIPGVGTVPLTRQDLMSMTKRDIEGISMAFNKNAVGPKMTIEGNCPKCSSKFVHPIEWANEDFFSISSQ